MRALAASDILELWERGRGQHQVPVERALTLLAAACPEKGRDELSKMSVGQRDGWLLQAREMTFGTSLNSYAECPGCGEGLEFALSVDDIRAQPRSAMVTEAREHQLDCEGYCLRFRLPTSRDLMALSKGLDLNILRDQLVDGCIVEARQDGKPISARKLPASVITNLADHMGACDPQAETQLSIRCTACGHQWQALLDISEFFWTEIADQAKRLLREIYTLARAFCWCEADILAMSSQRRQMYLEMLGT